MTIRKQRPSAGPPSERQLAKDIGVSRSWLWRCRQVANIPEDKFEALVESDSVPTVTQLVEIGRRTKPRRRQKRRTCPHCGGAL